MSFSDIINKQYSQCQKMFQELSALVLLTTFCLTFDIVSTENNNICSANCKLVYAPICVSDTKTSTIHTIANTCLFNYFQCLENDRYTFLHNHSCELGVEQDHMSKCHKFCFGEDEPICAIDKTGVQVTFQNRCYFDVIQCQYVNDVWKILKFGICNDNPIQLPNEAVPNTSGPFTKPPYTLNICPQEYNPVCAQDQRTKEYYTFHNRCYLDQAIYRNAQYNPQLSIVLNNTCDILERCLYSCEDRYKPVCGQDAYGNLYSFKNVCEFSKVTCLNPQIVLQIIHNNLCDQVV